MHRSDLQAILLATASAPIALKYNLTAAQLHENLKILRPDTNAHILERAAVLGTTHAPGVK